jgi:hypothetical protein
MGNQRGTFAKRRREQNVKDKARDKRERLARRRAEALAAKHAPIALAKAAQGNVTSDDAPTDESPVTASDDIPSG